MNLNMMNMNNSEATIVPSSRVSALTKDDIATAARNFRWTRQMPKWSVVVDGRELPARPLVLQAAGVPPNDPTNSHQAVAILKERGFDVRYQGETLHEDDSAITPSPEFEHLLHKLRGSCKGRESLVKAREHEHKDDRY
jgi:hypothetical protein